VNVKPGGDLTQWCVNSRARLVKSRKERGFVRSAAGFEWRNEACTEFGRTFRMGEFCKRTMQTQQDIREQLLHRYREIQGRLLKIARDVQHVEEPLAADFAEQAIQRENDEVLNALDGSIRAEMAEIERTLQRMLEGAYGICGLCGQAIAPQRLAALPYAIHCMRCEERLGH
jgi:DnaK suppressor protein